MSAGPGAPLPAAPGGAGHRQDGTGRASGVGWSRSGISGLRAGGWFPAPGVPWQRRARPRGPGPCLTRASLPGPHRGVRRGAVLGHGVACSALPGRGVSNLPAVPRARTSSSSLRFYFPGCSLKSGAVGAWRVGESGQRQHGAASALGTVRTCCAFHPASGFLAEDGGRVQELGSLPGKTSAPSAGGSCRERRC